MATEIQHEKAFPKQGAFLTEKTKDGKIHRRRWYKNIGLGFETPKTAIKGHYVDKKCPFTGNVSIRGRIIRGVILSVKMNRTIIVRRDYLHYVPKYKRFEKRHRNIPAHISPAFIAPKRGDIVTIGECRPLSKTVRFNVIKHEPISISATVGRKVFRLF